MNILNSKATETQIYIVRQHYDDLKNAYPQFDLGEWSESIQFNIVFDDLDNESNILYWIPPLKQPISYSPKTKIAMLVEGLNPEDQFAVLPSQKIVPFRVETITSSRDKTHHMVQTFYIAENIYENEFSVADEYFQIIAVGKVSASEFKIYKNYICEAQNLNVARKRVLKFKYYATMPFLYYLQRISPFLNFWTNLFHEAKRWMVSTFHQYTNDVEINTESVLLFDSFYVPSFNWFCATFGAIFSSFGLIVALYVMFGVIYHTVMLPFYALTLLMLPFFKFNFVSFCGVSVALFFANSHFFPKIMEDFLIDSMVQWDLDTEIFILPSFSSFDMIPQNTMKFLPFLMPKKRSYWFYVVALIFQVLFSFMFQSFIEN